LHERKPIASTSVDSLDPSIIWLQMEICQGKPGNADALAKVIQILKVEKVTLLMYENWFKVIKDNCGMFFKSS
jgi:hypothetical protein